MKINSKALEKLGKAKEIKISFVQAGCKGTKIKVEEEFERDNLKKIEANGIEIYCDKTVIDKIKNSTLAINAKGNFTLLSKDIKERCGCGSSFSFNKELISKDKLKNLRLAFNKNK